MDSTVTPLLCSVCSKPCVDGSYYIKEGKATCIQCAVVGIPSPVAQALANDAERKKAEREPLPQTLEAAHALEALARKLATTMLENAARIVEVEPPALLTKEHIDAAEHLVRMAQALDILADKVFARRG